MIQVLLICHVLVGAALLGAITHQAFSVARRPVSPPRSFVERFRGVNSPTFTNVIVLLFVANVVLGGLLYPRYRVDVRPMLEDLQLRAANGIFETKEHFAAVVLGLLPAYWRAWRLPLVPAYSDTRKYLTWMLAFIVWWNFLVGRTAQQHQGALPVTASARFNVFSMVYGVAYLALFFWSERYQSALFRYYPVLREFSRESLPLETAGPAILWYSWLLGAGVISFGVSFAVPRRAAERLGQGWIWAVPAALLVVILVYERRWFY